MGRITFKFSQTGNFKKIILKALKRVLVAKNGSASYNLPTQPF